MAARFGLTYLTEPRFYSPKLARKIEDRIHKSRQRRDYFGETEESFQERVFVGNFYSREIESHHLAPLILERIDEEKGHGLRAAEPLKGGTYIGEYTGIVRSAWPWRDARDPYTFRYPWHLAGWPFARRKVITTAATHGSLVRFLNHSHAPNARAHHVLLGNSVRLIIYTVRNVESGEEVTLDYGADYWHDSTGIHEKRSKGL